MQVKPLNSANIEYTNNHATSQLNMVKEERLCFACTLSNHLTQNSAHLVFPDDAPIILFVGLKAVIFDCIS